MPKRISKPKRPMPRLTAEEKDVLNRTTTSGNLTIEKMLYRHGNMATGPEHTPLGVMTQEQAEAYRSQRLTEVLGNYDDDATELP